MIPDSDLGRARSRLVEVVGADVALVRKGSELAGLCPFHNEKSPSFYVYPADGHYHCYGCGAHGSAIDFMMRRRNLDFPAAVRWLLDMPEASPAKRISNVARLKHLPGDTAARVAAILRECGPVAIGTAARLYLWSRGLDPDQPTLLAHPALYCHEVGKPLPALVAPITDSRGDVCAVQRIWTLDQIETVNGVGPQDARALLAVRKKTLGPMRDGAVRLAPAGATLGLAESVEKAIACKMLFRIACWAVCGAYRLGAVRLPPEVKTVVIFGDNDETGRDQGERARTRYEQQGCHCDLAFPDYDFKGWEDQLTGKRGV